MIIIHFTYPGNVAENWVLFNYKCIYLSDQINTFDGAQQACVSKNASLFIIKSQHEKDSILKLLSTNKSYRVGYRKTSTGWQWMDNSTYFPANWWRPGDPSAGDKTAYFYYYQNKWTFDGHSIIAKLYYICEKNCWRKMRDEEKYKMFGMEFMPNCNGLSCNKVCQQYPGCSSFAILSNTCVNMKDSSNAGEDCCINVPLSADMYTVACN